MTKETKRVSSEMLKKVWEDSSALLNSAIRENAGHFEQL